MIYTVCAHSANISGATTDELWCGIYSVTDRLVKCFDSLLIFPHFKPED